MKPPRAGPLPARWTFLIALGIYLLWAGWLGWQAAMLSRDVVSIPQMADAPIILEAAIELPPAPEREVTVLRVFRGEAVLGHDPDAGVPRRIVLANLDKTQGWSTPGNYLLALTPDGAPGRFEVIAVPTSPGYKQEDARPIYPANESTRAQVERIVRGP